VTELIDPGLSEALLVRLQDLASDLMSVVDGHGYIHYLNPAACKAYGVSMEDGMGSRVADHLDPDTVSAMLEMEAECRRTGRPTSMTHTVKGGPAGDLRLETVTAFDPETGYYYNVQRRVSDEVHDLRSLKVAERFLALTGDALAMFDRGGQIVTSNIAFDAMFGHDPFDDATSFASLVLRAGAPSLAVAQQRLNIDYPRCALDAEIEVNGERRLVSVSIQIEPDGKLRVLVARDVTAERRLEMRLLDRATTDPLTGLSNRATFIDALATACYARRSTGIVLLDLDGFKAVNDTKGHAVGDSLLGAVAQRLRRTIDSADHVARLGGDEFVVMTMTDDPMQSATTIAHELRGALSAPYDLDGHVVNLSASIGVASVDAGVAATPGALLHQADAAMYEAKRNGRNSYVVFDERLRQQTETRDELSSEIEVALRMGQIDIDVQAVVNLQNGPSHGVEALARWQHPSRGRLAPGLFLDLVAEKNLMGELTRCVLERSVTGFGHWLRADRSRALSINVPPMQLRDPSLLRSFVDACASEDIEHSQLICEFTEETLVDSIERTSEHLRLFRASGFSIAIDDFGAGASSLAYFRTLPVDFIKIDRSLIADTPFSRVDTTIVTAITTLAIDLGFKVCCEGVETAEQLEWLRTTGAHFAQGFHLHRPEPIDAYFERYP